jgi:hypothetical protein
MLGHQIVLDCGLNKDFTCQLNKDSLGKISINTQLVPAQYNYYLFISNHLGQTCQVTLDAETVGQKDTALWSQIDLKIYYQNFQLFSGDLLNFFSQKLDFLTLEAMSSKLYRLEFYLAGFDEDYQINFDLNFILNCQEKDSELLENKPEVLAMQSEDSQETLANPSIETKDNFHQQTTQLLFFLLSFLLIALIICLFWILKIKRSKKILISSKKGKSL